MFLNVYIEGAEVIESGNVFHREVTYGEKGIIETISVSTELNEGVVVAKCIL